MPPCLLLRDLHLRTYAHGANVTSLTEKVAYSTAITHTLDWMGLEGAPLLRAVWHSMEPEEGPQFRASFKAIFGLSFWDLVDELEESDDESLSASSNLPCQNLQ